MLGALNIGFLVLDHDPALGAFVAFQRQEFRHLFGEFVSIRGQFVVLDDAGPAVDVETNGIAI